MDVQVWRSRLLTVNLFQQGCRLVVLSNPKAKQVERHWNICKIWRANLCSKDQGFLLDFTLVKNHFRSCCLGFARILQFCFDSLTLYAESGLVEKFMCTVIAYEIDPFHKWGTERTVLTLLAWQSGSCSLLLIFVVMFILNRKIFL